MRNMRVIKTPPTWDDWVVALAVERARRREMPGSYHYWSECGDDAPPLNEYYCEHCVGWYGVPHTSHHLRNARCRFAGRRPRQCACIDCIVLDRLWADYEEES